MKPDPIVAEVRAVRDRLAARFNYDIDAIVRHIRSVEAASGRTYVQPPQSSIAAMNAATDVHGARDAVRMSHEAHADGHEPDFDPSRDLGRDIDLQTRPTVGLDPTEDAMTTSEREAIDV